MPRSLNANSASQVDVHVSIRVLHEGTLRRGDVDGKGDLHAVRNEFLFSRERGFRLGSRRDRHNLGATERFRRTCCHRIVAAVLGGIGPEPGKGPWDYRFSIPRQKPEDSSAVFSSNQLTRLAGYGRPGNG